MSIAYLCTGILWHNDLKSHIVNFVTKLIYADALKQDFDSPKNIVKYETPVGAQQLCSSVGYSTPTKKAECRFD